MATRNETRQIALEFITNAEETKSKIDGLISSLDKTSEEYADLQQQSASLASAINDVNNAMEHGSDSSNILQTSINKLEQEVDRANTSVNNLSKTSNTASKSSTNLGKSTQGLTEAVTSNGGAMSILNTITGGYASVVKDSIEATGLFSKETGLASIAQRAYASVVGTSTGALRVFKIALATTGIGLAIVAIGTLVANWDKLSAAIGLSNKQLTEFEKRTIAANNAVNNYTRRLDLEAKSLESIIGSRGLDNEIRAEALLQLQELLGVTDGLTQAEAKRAVQNDSASKIAASYVRLNRERLVDEKELAEQTDIYNDLLVKRNELTAKQEDFNNRSTFGKNIALIFQGYKNLNSELERNAEEIGKTEKALTNLYGLRTVYNSIQREETEDTEENTEAIREQRESIDELLKSLLELRRLYYINSSENVAVKLLREEEVAIARLIDAKEAQLEQNKIAKQYDAEAYAVANKDTNNYYDNEIAQSNKRIAVLKENEEQFSQILANNLTLLQNASYDNLRQIEKDVEDFIRTINDPEVADAYLRVFDIDRVRELSSYLKQFQPELQQHITNLMTYGRQLDENILNPESIKDRLQRVFDANAQELDAARNQSIEILHIEENEAIRKAEILQASEEELQNIRDYYATQRNQKELEFQTALIEQENNLRESKKQADLDDFNARMTILDATAQAQGSALEMALSFMSEEEQERAKASGAFKTLAIAKTTVDTYVSAMSAYRGMVETIPGVPGIIAGVAAAASAVFMGISNVNKIRKVKMPGGESGGGAGPTAGGAAPNVQFVSSSENQIANSVAGAMNNTNQEPIKAYVVSSDVSTAQELERNTIESNSL